MDTLTILSPHRDDAVFSLAIAMCRWRALPLRLRILNFFTRSTYAPRTFSSNARGEERVNTVSTIREREDRRAIRKVGRDVHLRSYSLEDAPLRLGIDASEVCRMDCIAVRESDVAMVSDITLMSAACGLLLAPLGLGNHVDHLTVSEAAIRTRDKRRVGFYEDLPYATWTPEEQILRRVSEVQKTTAEVLRPRPVHSSCNIYKKSRLARCYSSQITPDEAERIAGFATRYSAGERIWVPRHSRQWVALTH